jgi:hypothetical protein
MLAIPALAYDPVVEHAVERLALEFSAEVPPSAVRAFVVRARAELCADPPGALPELVERLARVRLLEVLGRAEEAEPGRETPVGPARRPDRQPRRMAPALRAHLPSQAR